MIRHFSLENNCKIYNQKTFTKLKMNITPFSGLSLLSAPQLYVSSHSQSLFMSHDQTFLIGEELQISENNKIKDEHDSIFWIKVIKYTTARCILPISKPTQSCQYISLEHIQFYNIFY